MVQVKSGIRKNLFTRLQKSKKFRSAYVREHVKQGVAHQLRAMREARALNQAQTAKLCGKSQSNIARYEDPDYGKFTLQTLFDIAEAFDVWLSVEFVSFKEGLRRSDNKTSDALNAESFSESDEHWRQVNSSVLMSAITELNPISSTKLQDPSDECNFLITSTQNKQYGVQISHEKR